MTKTLTPLLIDRLPNGWRIRVEHYDELPSYTMYQWDRPDNTHYRWVITDRFAQTARVDLAAMADYVMERVNHEFAAFTR